MFPKAKRGTSSWHVQLRLLSKSFAVATIPKTLAEQSYSACAFPMGLSALSAAAWNTIPFMAATFISAVPAGTRLLLPQGRLYIPGSRDSGWAASHSENDSAKGFANLTTEEKKLVEKINRIWHNRRNNKP